ncbi:MAG: 50S ribosomal protein L9 [Firmicutes bacterium]|nr:50S ribosomal protein L9 [Bacillota bacterium]
MQVYLLKDVPGKGKAGEVINVNDGYGKNYLVKNKLGIVADDAVIAKVKAKAQSDAFHTEQDKARIRDIIKKLEDVVVVLTVKVGEGGKMFGSVTSTEIARGLVEKGFEIEKRDIVMPEAIKMVGEYKIKVKFNYGLEGNFKLKVEG